MKELNPGEVFIWTNPPGTTVPLTHSPFRFAVGTPRGASTNSWRVWVNGRDVYVKCRDNFGGMKASLHASGNWRFGFTQEFVQRRPDVVPAGRDRAWTKWKPVLDNPSRGVIGFQIIALKGGLYLGPEKRKSWPPSVVFVEPAEEAQKMTVVSVTVIQNPRPVRINGVTRGGIVAILPLPDEWTVQVVATYEDVGTMEDMIKETFRTMVVQRIGAANLPNEGAFFVHGIRGENVPWVSALLYRKGSDGSA